MIEWNLYKTLEIYAGSSESTVWIFRQRGAAHQLVEGYAEKVRQSAHNRKRRVTFVLFIAFITFR